MVWQYIYKRSFISDMRFISQQPGEDIEWTTEVMKRLNSIVPEIKANFYFYNWDRNNSNMFHYNRGEEIK